MKTKYFLLLVQFILIGCSDTQNDIIVNRYVLHDKTDSTIDVPDCEELLLDMNVQDDSFGINLYIQEINDNRFNPITAFKLEPGVSGWLGNSHQRRNDIKSFKEGLCLSLERISEDTSQYDNSEIFRSVVGILQLMNKSETREQILIYSDLMEHSDIFCSYCDESIQALRSNLVSVADRFDNYDGIPNDLHGIELIIRHHPKSRHTETFQSMLKVYKIVFESRGAIVHHNLIKTPKQ